MALLAARPLHSRDALATAVRAGGGSMLGGGRGSTAAGRGGSASSPAPYSYDGLARAVREGGSGLPRLQDVSFVEGSTWPLLGPHLCGWVEGTQSVRNTTASSPVPISQPEGYQGCGGGSSGCGGVGRLQAQSCGRGQCSLLRGNCTCSCRGSWGQQLRPAHSMLLEHAAARRPVVHAACRGYSSRERGRGRGGGSRHLSRERYQRSGSEVVRRTRWRICRRPDGPPLPRAALGIPGSSELRRGAPLPPPPWLRARLAVQMVGRSRGGSA